MNKLFEKLSLVDNSEEMLIDYNLFFKMNEICRFSIDEENELQELNAIFELLKCADNNMSIYCRTYGVDMEGEKFYLYSDNLWICSNLSVKDIQNAFSKYDVVDNPLRSIVPSDISEVPKEEIMNNHIKYLIDHKGNLKNYILDENNVGKFQVISIYWD